ncbi:hypothetical protein BH11MYX4_BH11MYX4_02330 [soil metagenome]
MIDPTNGPSPLQVAVLAELPLSPVQATVLKLMGSEDLTDAELKIFRKLTGTWIAKPKRPYREFWATLPRRVGKTSRFLSCALVSCALDPRYEKNGAPGERFKVLISAPILEKTQALFSTALGLLDRLGVPYTRRDGEASLHDRPVDIVCMVQNVVHASADTAKGIFLDDFAKAQTAIDGAKFDKSFLESVRPMLLSTGGPLYSFSQAWAADGTQHETTEKFHGKTDGAILSMKGLATWEIVPAHTKEECWRSAGGDPRTFKREFEGLPGHAEDALLDADDVAACVATGVREKRRRSGVHYFAAADLSGMRRDMSALSIGHLESRRLPNGEAREVLVEDKLMIWRPGEGDPEHVIREMAAELRAWRIHSLPIDQFSYDLATSRFRHYGIQTELLKTDLASQAKRAEVFMGRLRSRTIELLDDADANRELTRIRMKLRSTGLFSYAAPERKSEHDDRTDARFAMVERAQKSGVATGGNIRVHQQVNIEPGVGPRVSTTHLQKTKAASGEIIEIPCAPPMGTELFDVWACDVLASGRSTPETDARLRELYGDGVITVAMRARFLAEHDPRFPPGEHEEGDDDAPPYVPEARLWRQTIERKIPRMF